MTNEEKKLIAELRVKQKELLAGYDEEISFFLSQGASQDAAFLRQEKEEWEFFFEKVRRG